MKSILLAGALLLATPVFFSACQEDAPEIDYEMKVTVVNDFTKVVEAINNGALKNEQAINQLKQAIDQMNADQQTKLQAIIDAVNAVNNTLDAKLAVIEAAIKAQTLSMEAKMELLKGVIAAQTTSLETKLGAIEAAIKAQTLSVEAKMDLIHDIIDAQTTALELKIAAIEAAVKAQTLSMEAKMDLIHDIIASQTSALELKLAAIKTAMEEESIALADKLALIEQAIKDQATNFDTKMQLLTTAVTSIPDYRDKLAAIETAINNVPDYATQLAAIEAVLNNVNSTLTDKLALLESIETAITESGNKLAAIKAVIDALPDYTAEFANIKTEIANLLQAVKDGTTSKEAAIAAIAAKIEELKAAGGITGGTSVKETMEYVDLGLPSGKKWSKKYLGAETATDEGDYYAWGETSPKDIADFTNENYGLLDGAWGEFRRYHGKDGWKQLMPYDDAATARLGNKWHIPTKTEVKELFDNCTAKEITLNGQPGIALVSKINNNYIFFRNNGYRSDNKWYFATERVCWTADLDNTDVEGAIFFMIYIDEGNIGTTTKWVAYRSDGMNIRPIYY
mgnify:CR=1 FL=1